jgi:putative membrane protein
VAARKGPQYTRLAPSAPPVPLAIALLLALAGLCALLTEPLSSGSRWLEALLGTFLAPALLASALTPAAARSLGGRFTYRRSFLLGIAVLVVTLVFLFAGYLLSLLPGLRLPSAIAIVVVVQGFALWLRHMALFGVSRASHARSLPPALLQPVFTLAFTFLLLPSGLELWVASLVMLAVGWGAAALVIRGSDRPIRREFDASGIALIRPMLDHVAFREPGATAELEAFFRRHAVPADLRVGLLEFRGASGAIASVALPTVHPGPFAALGASDLPRHITEALGPSAGLVFVPHTPCTHDLDLPSSAERARILDGLRGVRAGLAVHPVTTASPLVEPRPGSLVRVQRLGPVLWVLLSQAPAPTDDIDFAIADTLRLQLAARGDRFLALVDAHNSYRPDEGDLSYGTPVHRQLASDFAAAVSLADAESRSSTLRAGAAASTDFTVGTHGIGPTGIRALVLEAAGTRTAYVLIDGNNLVQGERATILSALAGVVDAADVMTTDNHVVHEADGGVNPVGERLGGAELAAAVRSVVERANGALAPAELGAGSAELPGVLVLGPGWTARLLTSLGDTLSVFANLMFATFLILLSTALLALAVLR